MRLSTKGRYAVTAMLDLALNGVDGPVTLAEISENQGISLSYLEQLFAALRSKGLVRGAAVGAVVGSSSSDTKKAAGAGMAIGGMRAQDQKRKEAQKREQWEQEQVRIYTENRNRYNRAYAACLEGKNYTVR